MNLREKLGVFRNNFGVVKYFINTSWLLAEKILRMTVGIFVGVWVARHLGPSQYGSFSYAQSVVVLFSAFSTLGLDAVVVRELVKNVGQRDKILGTAFVLKLIGSSATFILIGLVFFFLKGNQEVTFLVTIVAFGNVILSLNVIDFYFQSTVMSKYVALSNSMSLLLSSALKIVLILNDAPLMAFAYVVIFDSFVSVCGFGYFYLNERRSLCSWFYEKQCAIFLLKNSWPLILSTLLVSLYMKIDQVMINEMLGSYEVGHYAAAVRLSEAFFIIPVVIAASLFPAIVNAKEISSELYYSRMQNIFDLMVFLAVIVAIPMTFFSDWLILFLYGIEYSESAEILSVHIWTAVFVFVGVASSKWIVAEGLQIYSLYRTGAGALLNVILNLILIPEFAIYGAAIATLCSQCVASYLFNMLFTKTRIIFRLQTNSLLLPLRKLGVNFG